nr:immunoglobulin heavy chain junction region [Macaca mulatta]
CSRADIVAAASFDLW